MKKRQYYIVTLLLVWTISLSIAQTKYQFKHYTTADGLPGDAAAEQAVQDGLGFLWMNQAYALTRFDGYIFKVYSHYPGDSLLNLDTKITGRLIIDPKGNLWINGMHRNFHNGYLLKYDPDKDAFIQYKPDTRGFLIKRISFDTSNTMLWLGARAEGGIFSYDLKTNKAVQYLNSPKGSFCKPCNMINAIQDRDSLLLLSTEQGLWFFSKEEKKFSRPKSNSKDSTLLYHSVFWDLFPNKDGTYWVEIPGAMIKIDSHFSVVHRYAFPKKFNYDTEARDGNGIFWFQGYLELYRWDPETEILEKIPNMEALGVNMDRDDNLLVSTLSGISRLEKSPVPFFNSRFNSGINHLQESDNTLYAFGDEFYSTHLRLKDSLQFEPLNIDLSTEKDFDQKRKSKKYFWISLFLNGVVGLPLDPAPSKGSKAIRLRNDPENVWTISSDSASTNWEDSVGNLWVGTYNKGFSIVNPGVPYGQQGSVKHFVHNPSDTTTVNDNLVRAIVPEDENSVWIATEKGVDLFKDGKFIHVFKNKERVSSLFKAADGTVYVGTMGGLYEGREEGGKYNFKKSIVVEPLGEQPSMAEDETGRLWIIHRGVGVICYDRKLGIATKFNKQNGLIPDPYGLFHIANRLFIAISPGSAISLFDPLSLQVNMNATHPMFTKLEVNNREAVVIGHPVDEDDYVIGQQITVLNNLELDYLHNNFTLEFSAMEMTAPEKNLYRHKLEGYDKDWIETDYKSRTATYTNLPSGTYTFRVKASNHNGVWSDNERTLSVIILPPPWRTWWAYAGYSLLVIGLLVWARRNIVQRERLKASLQLEQVEHEKEHFELEKAKEVDRVKTSFFTNISHEFRTPLTLIKGPVQDMLEQYKDDPKLRERLKLIERNSDLLLKLINQLLDLAKLESGSLKVEKTEGDVFSFVRAIASSFESFARQKNVAVLANVPEGSCPALFDKDKVETILINLINNAIKFTPAQGSITVNLTPNPSPEERGAPGYNVAQTIKGSDQKSSDVFQSGVTPSLLERGKGGEVNWVQLTVKDTGIGIPPDQQSKIFERFHQVSEAHKEVGTGIGLALVKELVTLMGGTISVSSEVGKGSEFVVVLPIEMAAGLEPQAAGVEILNNEVETPIINSSARSLKPAANSPEDEGGAKPHILVVEDNTDLRHFIIDSLGSEFSYLEAENGKQGLEKATEEIPDLIISDVMMPEMDGITMTGKIKKDLHTSHIPIIILTAKSSEDSMLSGLSSGADDYLTKPFNKNELLLKVRNGVTRQVKLREKLRAELMSTAPPKHVLSEDEKFLNSVKEKILERLSDEQLSVESLAEDIGMSRVQLYRKVSGLTDISVNELIRKLRLQRAAQLLSQNWGPVSQVAYEVGFSNLSYFSKVFKEEFGMLPSEYS